MLVRGHRRIPHLRAAAAPEPAELPRLSVVLAARNEADRLEPALRSLLDQDYPSLEVVAVDDRSTDGTGAILDRLADERPALEVLHLERLPAGWLGKTHALWRGALRSEGELLLFTDADVHFRPSVLRRAVGRLLAGGGTHLVVAPQLQGRGWLLQAAIGVFQVVFGLYFQPWRAPEPDDPHFVGAGAFNLVRREAYEGVGGHREVRLRPDEDLRLGQRLKRAGGRQLVLYGDGLLRVEWYRDVPDLVRGLEKNAFAISDYDVGRTVLGNLGLLVLAVGPAVGLVAGSPPTTAVSAVALLAMFLAYADTARHYGSSIAPGLLFPLGASVLAFAGLRATLLALARGRVRWRSTEYDLDELRRHRVGEA